MMLEYGIFSNAVQGVTFSLIFAFLVLVFTTGNVFISLIAIGMIGLVVASLMALIVLKQWELGFSESIGVVVFVGFSVDYIVHMGHHY